MSTVEMTKDRVLRAAALKLGAMETVNAIDDATRGECDMLNIPSVAYELLRDYPRGDAIARKHLEALSESVRY